jgi:hypothetical protein
MAGGSIAHKTYSRNIHQTRNNATMASTTCAIHWGPVFGFPKLNTDQS